VSFVAFIKSFQAGDDAAAGDFARDARNDRKLPDAESWRELELYLSKRGVTDRATATGKRVRLAYEDSREKVAASEAPSSLFTWREPVRPAHPWLSSTAFCRSPVEMTCL